MTPPEPTSDAELDLPPLDGAADDDEAPAPHEDLSVRAEDDPYDDAEAGDEALRAELDSPDEPSAVGDADVGFAAEAPEPVAAPDPREESMLGDEDAPGTAGEDFGIVDGDDAVRDAGEEGFDAPEPELRVEDLPRLDEGDDDNLTVDEAAEDVLLPAELRWDDRGFERVANRAVGHVVRVRLRVGLFDPPDGGAGGGSSVGSALDVTLDDGSTLRSVDGGETFHAAEHDGDDEEALIARGRVRALLREGVGVLRAVDEGPLVLVESTAEASAFTVLNDGSLVVAIDARLLRVSLDETTTLVAEEENAVEALASDERSGLVWSGGAFGLVAYKPR